MANYKVTSVGIPLRETRFTFIGQDIKNADVGKAVTHSLLVQKPTQLNSFQVLNQFWVVLKQLKLKWMKVLLFLF